MTIAPGTATLALAAQSRWHRAVLRLGRQLTAVAISRSGETLQIGAPRPLFPFPPDSTYDVAPKTGRFLISSPANRPEPATVVLNWRAPDRK